MRRDRWFVRRGYARASRGGGGGGATGADKQQTPPSDDVTGPEEEEDDDEFLDHPAPIYRRGGSDRVITGHEFSTRQRI